MSSAHTKHTLEALHPNISVFRHPDHIPDEQAVAANFWTEVKEQGMTAATAAKLPLDALKAVYGTNEETVLYWAHHEKLCLIDGHIAFMGGLDLCYGRWDTNQVSTSDLPLITVILTIAALDCRYSPWRPGEDRVAWSGLQQCPYHGLPGCRPLAR